MTNDSLNIALIQTHLFWEEAAKNRLHMETFFERLPEDVDLVVLPEMFPTGFSMNVEKCSEPMDGETISWLKTQAAKYQKVFCGSLMIKESGNYFNRFVFIQPDSPIQFYDKRHLFSMGQEHLHFSPGKERKVFQLKSFRILPQICYDLRFPVFSRNRNDYDLLINCANWPASRQQVWDILLKARAIENQAYVVGVNRTGVDDNGIRYSGGSQVVDPKGVIVQLAGDSEELIIAKLSKPSLEKFRRSFPVLGDADDFLLS